MTNCVPRHGFEAEGSSRYGFHGDISYLMACALPSCTLVTCVSSGRLWHKRFCISLVTWVRPPACMPSPCAGKRLLSAFLLQPVHDIGICDVHVSVHVSVGLIGGTGHPGLWKCSYDVPLHLLWSSLSPPARLLCSRLSRGLAMPSACTGTSSHLLQQRAD